MNYEQKKYTHHTYKTRKMQPPSVFESVLRPVWTALIVASSIGLLGAALAEPGMAAKLTVFVLGLNAVARANLVPDVRASAAVLGVLMVAAYWILVAAEGGYAGLYGVQTLGDLDDPFAELMIHLILPLDAAVTAAVARRRVAVGTVGRTALLSLVYAIVFVAVAPYGFAQDMTWVGRAGLGAAGVALATGVHAGLAAACAHTTSTTATRPRRRVMLSMIVHKKQACPPPSTTRPRSASSRPPTITARTSAR